MVGQGEYAGDLITLSHMPVSENKRFQLGTGGNSHNCNYGFGGWFAGANPLNAPAVVCQVTSSLIWKKLLECLLQFRTESHHRLLHSDGGKP